MSIATVVMTCLVIVPRYSHLRPAHVSHFQTREERRGWCPPLSDGRQRVQHLSDY